MRYASLGPVTSKLSFVCMLLVGCISVPDIATERDAGPYDAPCMGANTMMCEGGCANTNRDPNHCGGCGNICDLNEDCIGGNCISDRPLEFILDWNQEGDVDLHVVRPDGQVIWYGDQEAPVSSSGLDGVLDRDDQTGTGPERVSFSTPTAGDYLVCVNNFGGVDPLTSWRLRIRENSDVRQMETGAAGARDRDFRCAAENALFTYAYVR